MKFVISQIMSCEPNCSRRLEYVENAAWLLKVYQYREFTMHYVADKQKDQ